MAIGDQGRRRRLWSLRGWAIVGFALLAPAAAAGAQVPTLPTVPLPPGILDGPTVPETGGPASPTTTPTPTPTTVPPQPLPAAPPTTTARRPTTGSELRRSPGAPRVAPSTTAAVPLPAPGAAGEQAAKSGHAHHGGAVPTARELGFPLALAALVSAFVVVQGRLDYRDPKLAAAPISVDDDLLPFA